MQPMTIKLWFLHFKVAEGLILKFYMLQYVDIKQIQLFPWPGMMSWVFESDFMVSELQEYKSSKQAPACLSAVSKVDVFSKCGEKKTWLGSAECKSWGKCHNLVPKWRNTDSLVFSSITVCGGTVSPLSLYHSLQVIHESFWRRLTEESPLSILRFRDLQGYCCADKSSTSAFNALTKPFTADSSHLYGDTMKLFNCGLTSLE